MRRLCTLSDNTFLPILIGDDISKEKADIFCLPLHNADLAITNPVKTDNHISKHQKQAIKVCPLQSCKEKILAWRNTI